MSDFHDPRLQLQVSKDSRELLSFLIQENIPGCHQVVEAACDLEGAKCFEKVVLQVARAYAICAFEQSSDLENLSPDIDHALEAFPGLAVVIDAYRKHVDLRSLNEELSAESNQYQSQRLEDYLAQFSPDFPG